MTMNNTTRLMTIREVLLARLKTYEEEVRSGRHVPPPPRAEAPLQTASAAAPPAIP